MSFYQSKGLFWSRVSKNGFYRLQNVLATVVSEFFNCSGPQLHKITHFKRRNIDIIPKCGRMSCGTRTHIHTKQLIELIYLAWFLVITEWTIEHCVQGFNILLLRPGLPLRLSSSHLVFLFLKPEAFKQTEKNKGS